MPAFRAFAQILDIYFYHMDTSFTPALTATHQKILDLLGSGLPEGTVASAVGCTPAYISQLLSEPEFRSQVLEKRVVALQAQSKRDGRYDALEDRLLERLEEILPFMSRSAEVTRAMQVVNAAKRRGSSIDQPAQLENTRQVILNMPVSVINQFALSASREVIEVNGKPMVSATSQQLKNMVDAAQGEK